VLQGIAQRLVHTRASLANATPADGIEVEVVDDLAKAETSTRLVFIHIVKRLAGVEAGRMADADALAQLAQRAEARALHDKRQTFE
jgi:light-regulated signal transduction histidine kinase (bacteriophytochrome)